MAAGLGEQLESMLTWEMIRHDHPKPWLQFSKSGRFHKTTKLRRERRRARLDPECMPQHRKYCGYQ